LPDEVAAAILSRAVARPATGLCGCGDTISKPSFRVDGEPIADEPIFGDCDGVLPTGSVDSRLVDAPRDARPARGGLIVVESDNRDVLVLAGGGPPGRAPDANETDGCRGLAAAGTGGGPIDPLDALGPIEALGLTGFKLDGVVVREAGDGTSGFVGDCHDYMSM
jgi:hypothetical protein